MARTIGGRMLGGATIALAAAAASCSAILGIGDRVADDSSLGGGEAGADSTPPLDSGAETGSAAFTYGVGDGHWGSLTISSGRIVNSYAPLQTPVSGASSLIIRATRGAAFVAGDLVIVWQTATTTPPPSSGPVIDVAAANVGHWEVARVTAITGLDGGDNELALDHPVGVVHPYTTPGAQVVRVPEYQDLTIPANQWINAERWDGASGGMVALYVRGTLTNNGGVYADRAGFRGGVAFLTNDGGLAGCAAADGLPEDGFARKGEGFVLGLYDDGGGFGNAASGGGGGDCFNAGGGGGGHGGQGGQGGLSGDGDRDVGGRGGAALAYTLPDRLMLGGGGGAGEQDDGTARSGGNGGGIILARAQEIALPGGQYDARGGSPARGDYSGAPGGGAGGTIVLQAAGTLASTSATVRGGAGASFLNANGSGPGGGGAGGRTLIQGGAMACSLETRAGAAGHDGPDTATRGATPDASAALDPPYTAPPQLIPSPYCGTCP